MFKPIRKPFFLHPLVCNTAKPLRDGGEVGVGKGVGCHHGIGAKTS